MKYAWEKATGWGLTGSVCVMGAAGLMALFQPAGQPLFGVIDRPTAVVVAFALMAVLSVLSANNHAAAAMRALSRRPAHLATLIPALICSAGFAVAAGLSVEMAWSLLKGMAPAGVTLPDDRWVVAATVFLSFAKPATFWVIAGLEEIDRLEAADRDREETAAAERLAAERRAAAEAAERAAMARREVGEDQLGRLLREIRASGGKVLAGVGAGAAALEGVGAPPASAGETPAHAPPAAAAQRSYESADAKARTMIIDHGVRAARKIAKECGLSRHRAAKLLDLHAPGWRDAAVPLAL